MSRSFMGLQLLVLSIGIASGLHLTPSTVVTTRVIKLPPSPITFSRCRPVAASRPPAATFKAAVSLETGLSAALAYATISAVWYVAGMAIYLCTTAAGALPPAAAAATVPQPLRHVIRRLSTAWVVTFAASQVTTLWRGAGALALSPLLGRIIRGTSATGSRAGVLLRAALYAVVIASAFAGGVGALGARELVALNLK